MSNESDQSAASEGGDGPETVEQAKALPPGVWVTGLIVIVLLLLAVFGLN